jgi:hypothetical protein
MKTAAQHRVSDGIAELLGGTENHGFERRRVEEASKQMPCQRRMKMGHDYRVKMGQVVGANPKLLQRTGSGILNS